MPKLTESAEKFFNQIIDEIPNFITGAEQLTDGILHVIQEIIPKLLPIAKSLLETLVNGLQTALPQLSEFAQELIQKISDFIQENLPLLISAAIQLIAFLCENLLTQENIALLVSVAIQIIQAICENLLTGENLELLLKVAVALVTALADAIVNNLDDILIAAEGIIRKLCDELKNPEKIKEIVALGTELLAKLIVGICQIGGQLAGFSLSLHEEIRSVCEAIDWAEIGKDILEGILSGLLGVNFDLGSFFGEFGDNFMIGIKEIFGIHSPSKRMRDEIGKFLLPGIAVGVEDSVDSTQQDINHALDTMMDSVDMDSLQLKLKNPEISENFNAILSQIDFSRLQTQFDAAMQSLGFSAIAQPTQIYNQIQNTTEQYENYLRF
ncbi:MAG: hypothetical protein K2J71_06460 [Oscillospiraceae bacterium]|nr:hypothetical protein [Oscillospiraceae bacterium]